MSTIVGASVKGWMKNTSTGEKMPFLFNPTELFYERGATYAENASPGSPYPMTTFVRGNAVEFSVPLFLYDLPYTGRVISYLNFFDKFLPSNNPLAPYEVPPEMLFCQGYFIRTCVVMSYNVQVHEFDKSGGPKIATITLNLRQVGL